MHTVGTQAIETERLLLRRARLDDAGAMFRNWASDPEVTTYLTWPAYRDEAGVRQYLEGMLAGYQDSAYFDWLIELKERGEAIGSIGFVRYDEAVDALEVGYVIGRNWWGRGLAAEALRAVIDFGFRELGVNRIMAQHDALNPNSGRVMQKCGMSYEGTLRQAGRNNRGVVDLCVYGILRQEWQ